MGNDASFPDNKLLQPLAEDIDCTSLMIPRMSNDVINIFASLTSTEDEKGKKEYKICTAKTTKDSGGAEAEIEDIINKIEVEFDSTQVVPALVSSGSLLDVLSPGASEAIRAHSAARESASVTGGLNVVNNRRALDASNEDGMTTPLHRLASDKKWIEMREYLMAVSPRPAIESKTQDEYGRTPLMVACMQGLSFPTDVARLLVVTCKNAVSQPMVRKGGESYCLHIGASSGCSSEVMQVLCRAYPEAASTKDYSGALPLHLAINTTKLKKDEQVSVSKILIKTSTDGLLTKNPRGETPLVLAICRRVPLEVLNLLLENDAGKEAARLHDSFKCLPLHFCDRAPVSIIRELVKIYPAGIGLGNKLQDTPFFFAIQDNVSVTMLEIMLKDGHEPGVAVKRKNSRGINIFHAGWAMLNEPQIVAAEDQDEEDQRVVLNKICVRDATQIKELFGGVRNWWRKMELLLRASYHGSIADPLPNGSKWLVAHALAFTECPPDLIKFVLQIHEKGATEIDENGNSPLHIATRLPDIVSAKSISYFVDSFPTSTLHQNKDGNTPLHVACLYHAPLDVLKVLLDESPDACLIQNKDGQTPLFIAIAVNSDIDVLRLLLRNKPEAVHIRGMQGMSVIGFAWLLLISGTIIEEKDNKAEQSRGKSSRINIAVARTSSSLVGDVREWMSKIDLLLRAAFHAYTDLPLLRDIQWRAVHAASMGRSVPPALLRFALQILPNEVCVKNEAGNLPLHIAASAPAYDTNVKPELATGEALNMLLELNLEGAKRTNRKGRLPLHLAIASRKTWLNGIKSLLDAFPEAAKIRDPLTMLYPFMLAACVAIKTDDDEVFVEIDEENTASLTTHGSETDTDLDSRDGNETHFKIKQLKVKHQESEDKSQVDAEISLFEFEEKKESIEDVKEVLECNEIEIKSSQPNMQRPANALSDPKTISLKNETSSIKKGNANIAVKFVSSTHTEEGPIPPEINISITSSSQFMADNLQKNKDSTQALLSKFSGAPSQARVTSSLASLNTIYELLRLAPNLVSSKNGNAEIEFLWRSQRELRNENIALKTNIIFKEKEIRARMSRKELKESEENRRTNEIQKNEKICAERENELEKSSNKNARLVSQVEGIIHNLKGIVE